MWNGARHLWRLLTVARTLARHDALFPLDSLKRPPPSIRLIRAAARWLSRRRAQNERPGIRLARALQALGPAFVKLGQALATRPDLIGREVAGDLTSLQDRLPPFSAADARRTIEEELGQPINSLLPVFENGPVAAASIAQVHYAETADGRGVAVKVLRPEIEQRFAREFESFLWVARMMERTRPETRRLRPVEVVRTLERSTQMEMDLRLEAAAASELGDNVGGQPGYRVPQVHWPLTSRRVLTMERVGGINIADADALEAEGHDRTLLARTVIQAFLSQAMRDGFFHADLHQGNLFVEPDGTVVAVDFGIMGRLDREQRRFLAEILWGFINQDYDRVAAIHFEAGYVPSGQSRGAFAQAMRAIGEPIHGLPVSRVSFGRLLAQLFTTTERFEMSTRPELLLLQKTMVMAEGLARQLDPEINMWDASRPVIEDWMRDNLGPEARIADAIDGAISLARAAPRAFAALESLTVSGGSEGDPLDTGPPPSHLRGGRIERLLLLVLGLLGGILIAGLVAQ